MVSNVNLRPYTEAGKLTGTDVGRRRCKLDPGLNANRVSNFDCEKKDDSAFNLKPLVRLSLRPYTEINDFYYR